MPRQKGRHSYSAFTWAFCSPREKCISHLHHSCPFHQMLFSETLRQALEAYGVKPCIEINQCSYFCAYYLTESTKAHLDWPSKGSSSICLDSAATAEGLVSPLPARGSPMPQSIATGARFLFPGGLTKPLIPLHSFICLFFVLNTGQFSMI